MGLARRDSSRCTYADYLIWPDEPRCELVDGIAYAMALAPSPEHQGFVVHLSYQLVRALEGTPCRVFVAPLDVRLADPQAGDDAVDTVVQPDLLVVCDASKIDERGVRGAPDWIAEVLSPATASHDQIIKLSAYERAGVREYWLVHPGDRIVTVYRLAGGRYGRAAIHELSGALPIDALPGASIDWDRIPPLPSRGRAA
ncbi:MAG: Uma2 family endonuclease [Burkholderiales bacterium]|nr:Uma2 family endonuclease [Burkholderiales bacterium]